MVPVTGSPGGANKRADKKADRQNRAREAPLPSGV